MRPPLPGLLGRAFPGRPDPPRPAAEDLHRLVSALPALTAGTGFVPTGAGAVCYRLVEGGAFGAFAGARRELDRLLGGPDTEVTESPYGHAWTRLRRPPEDFDRLVADLYLVRSTLERAGFGAYLLYAAVGFRRRDRQRLFLVHLPSRGTFYPFAPRPGGRRERRRNNAVEAAAREAVAGELPVEADTGRWFPLWDAPVLD
ncbi:PspA-associated protein PspAB [Actinomadura kijaniata]|uniref:PspA-associated protein PspAB n=1 Tax=Actinomadura kijaniata TaxID=46161 RepID=UPI000834CA95|nr:hypothetical protein [Actinomadura kijaniata]